MAKVLRREVLVADTRDKDNLNKLKKGDPSAHPVGQVTLHPGDEVPSWVDDDAIEEEWYDDGVAAAGSNLYDDNVYQVVKAVADERGVEYGEGWDAAQIAAAIRYEEHAEQVVTDLDLDEDEEKEALDEGRKAMADLFESTNDAGNLHAPDQAAKSSRKVSSSPSGTSGGAHSSSA